MEDLSSNDVTRVLSFWGIRPLSYAEAKGGYVNDNMVVSIEKGKYVLQRMTDFKSLKGLKLEIEQLLYLKKHKFGYQIPEPMTNKSGTYYIKYKKRYFWIYKYIGGKIKSEVGEKELKDIAKMMIKYHSIIKKSKFSSKVRMKDPFFKKAILNQSKSIRSEILAKRVRNQKDKIFLRKLNNLIPLLRSFKTKEYARLKTYAIQRDFRLENLIWRGDTLVGLIDFDRVGWSLETIAKDISVVIQHCCVQKNDKNKLNFKLAKFFIQEYERYSKLSKVELEYLPILIAVQYIDLFNYSYFLLDKKNCRVTLKEVVKWSKAAQWYATNKDTIIYKLST